MLKQQKKWATIKFSTKHRVIISLVGIIVMFIESAINFGPEATNQKEINTVVGSSKLGIFYLFALIILGSIIEEFFFRFMIIGPNPIGKQIKSKKGYIIQMIVSSLLFGLWHLNLTIRSITTLSGIINLSLTSINYVLAGVILAYLYVHTQDIRVSLAAHMGSDLLDLLMMLI